MKKLIISVAIILVIFLLFGCTISVNPQDPAPCKNYLVISDANNVGSQTNLFILYLA